METVKFRLKKNYTALIDWSSIINSIFSIVIISGLIYEAINKTYDAENFPSFLLNTFFILLVALGFTALINYLQFKNLKKHWGAENSDTIEIAEKEIDRIIDSWDFIKVETKTDSFNINKKYFENLDFLTKAPHLLQKETPTFNIIGVFYVLIFFAFAAGTVHLIQSTPSLYKYNLKYHFPTLQIETTQIDATYVKAVTEKHNFYIQEVVIERYTVLINNTKVELKVVEESNLVNKIYNRQALTQLKKGSPVRIKIRTKDYENLIKNGKPKWFIRFYELEANGDILYQKRGLKEDFETATF